MARRGRKRSIDRDVQKGPAWTPEQQKRREESTGVSGAGSMHYLGGYPLGILLMRGVIDDDQHTAGEWYGAAVRRMRSLAGIPQPWVVGAGGIKIQEPDREEWVRCREDVLSARAAMSLCDGKSLVLAAIDMIAADMEMPPWSIISERPQALSAIRRGLNAIKAICPRTCKVRLDKLA